MTDYKNLKLIASSSPHIRSNEDTRSIMLDVIIALLPALAWSVYCFGWKALVLTLVSVVSCVFFEWAYRKLMKKSCMVGDLSAVVTGILLSFVCPVDLPWWTIIIGAFFSIVVVKQLYGGIGCNFLNPALAGRAFLLASYATAMTTWAIPRIRPDVTSAATPMTIMKEGTEEAFTTLISNYSIGDMFLGKVGGSLGEVSALCLLVGGVYLLIRKVISWQIPVAYIGTVAILTLIAAPAGIDGVQYMLYNVFGGGHVVGDFHFIAELAALGGNGTHGDTGVLGLDGRDLVGGHVVHQAQQGGNNERNNGQGAGDLENKLTGDLHYFAASFVFFSFFGAP